MRRLKSSSDLSGDLMKISQKRTCNQCVVFIDFADHCDLGYKINGHVTPSIPLEPCPKPKTYDEYMEALYKYKKDRRFHYKNKSKENV